MVLPIEIAYAPIEINEGKLTLDKSKLFDQLYQVGTPISYAAMAVHHIRVRFENQPHYKTFKLPETTTYIIGHNIDYDIARLLVVAWMSHIKPICTQLLARKTWPERSA